MGPTANDSGPPPPPPAAGAGRRPSLRLWQGAGLLWMLTCLAGLAIGLWPQATFPTRTDVITAPLPTLGALAVAQAGFVLLIYPMVLLVRSGRGRTECSWPLVLAESGLCMVMAVPFYVVAGFLGNAAVGDVVRTAIALACLWPAAWAAGAWLATRPASRAVVMLAMVLAAIALPAAMYVAKDFLGSPGAAATLWHLAPATFVYQAAQARVPAWLPGPTWAAVCWPAAGAAAMLLLLILPRRTASP